MSAYSKKLLYKYIDNTLTPVISSETRTAKKIIRLRSATDRIDYGCTFDDKGVCPKAFEAGNPMCCCRRCHDSFGYLFCHNNIVIDSHLTTYSRLFKKDVGFWREGIGCLLPREMRSTTCLAYCCTDNLRTLMYLFYEKMMDMRREKKWLTQ